jgi:hypothetical protein
MGIFIASSFRLHPVKTGCDARALVDFAWVSSADMNGVAMKFYRTALLVGLAGTMLIAGHRTATAEVTLMPRPNTCERQVTVQKSGCQVENIFRCEIDGETLFRSETSDAFGLRDISIGNDERGLVVFGDPYGNYEVRYDSSRSRSSSVAELLEHGSGKIDDIGYFEVFGIRKPFATIGTVTIEDVPVSVSGRTLTRIRADEVVTLPPPIGELSGISFSYLDQESGLIFSGEGSDPMSGSKQIMTQGRPKVIDFPGDRGFGIDVPEHDCGEFSFAPLPRDQRREEKT